MSLFILCLVPSFLNIVPRIFRGNSLCIGLPPITYLPDQAVQARLFLSPNVSPRLVTGVFSKFRLSYLVPLRMLGRQYGTSIRFTCLDLSNHFM